MTHEGFPRRPCRGSLFAGVHGGGCDGPVVAITRDDLDAAGLRRAAAKTRNADAARRMPPLALVLDGRTRHEAVELCGMDLSGDRRLRRRLIPQQFGQRTPY